MSTILMLNVSEIGYDQHYYPRVNGAPDWITILRYTESLLTNPAPFAGFPPIVVVRCTGRQEPYLLIDGLHRLRAAIKAELEQVPVIVERIPQSKWLARSVELNAVHGRPLDTGDKAWIVSRLKEEGWELSDIAGLMKMRVESLEKIYVSRCQKISSAEAEAIPVGRSNRTLLNGKHVGYLKAPLIGTTSKQQTIDALATQHSVTSHDVDAILDSMISVLTAGAVDVSVEKTAAKVASIRKLLRELSKA